LIAINQDSLGKAATTFTPKGQSGPRNNALYKYWTGPLSDGVVIGLVAADGPATLSVNFADVPGLDGGMFQWTELYSGQNGTGTSVTQKLDNHDMAVFKIIRGQQ
jgi:alpha-galactosidase